MTEIPNKLPTEWSLPVSLMFTAVVVPALFWLRFGYVDGYAYGFTAFLMLLETAVDVLPRRMERFKDEKPTTIRPGRFDFLGVGWLLLIPFGPLFGWCVTNFFDVGLSNWRLLIAIKTILCVIGPVVCVLPLIRYIRHPHAAFMTAVLVIGTAFPVATGLGTFIDLLRGPQWQNVEITNFHNIGYRVGSANVRVKDAFVELADGRTLTRTQSVTLRRAAANVLVLRGMGRIIDVRDTPSD